MADLRVTTLTGDETKLPTRAVDEFKKTLGGELIAPDDGGYEEARKVWNANIDRRPGLIVRPTGVADVINTVNFARDHALLVAVRGGAHSFAGTGVCDGGLVIDLSRMKGIRVDPVRQTVRAEAGVRWVSSIARRRRSAWPLRGASSPIPASPVSPSVAAMAGSDTNTGSCRTT